MNAFFAPSQDLTQIVNQNRTHFENLRNANLLILGGTGFIGRWLTQTLSKANLELNLEMHIIVVARDAQKAQKMFGRDQVQIKSVSEFMDNRFSVTNSLDFSHVIFAATSTSEGSEINEVEILSLILQALNLSASGNSIPSFLHLSSGAAGFQSNSGKYAALKRKLELIVEEHNSNGLVLGSNPRIFTTYGPGLPLKDKYAIGNFMLDGISGKSIHVRGNPSTLRSYIYISDLVSSLLELLTHPEITRIDIGSSEAISMQELAETISREFGERRIIFQNVEQDPSIYIPDLRYLRANHANVSLSEGVRRWRVWAEST